MEAKEVLYHFLPFMIRLILGGLFFFQAYDKLVRIGLKETFATAYSGYRDRPVPKWFVRWSIWLSTYIELIGGALLILGLFKSIALILLGINLIMVVMAFSYLKGMWDMQHVFPRLVLLITLFLIPFEWDTWTLDRLFG